MATDSTGGAIAGAAVTTLGNAAVAAASNKRAFKNQMKAMEQQQVYNRELWDYQNAYNTPQEQMKRLQEAGLNPRLIYGGGSANTGNAGPISPTDVPAKGTTTPELPDMWQKRLIVRQADAQYAATMQNINLGRTKANLNELNSALLAMKNMQESARSKNYQSLALSEQRLAKFTAERSKQLMYNEQSKGTLLDQLQEVRQVGLAQQKEQLTSQQLENTFKRNRNDLAALGIYSTDDVKWRAIIAGAARLGIPLDELLKSGGDYLRELIK